MGWGGEIRNTLNTRKTFNDQMTFLKIRRDLLIPLPRCYGGPFYPVMLFVRGQWSVPDSLSVTLPIILTVKLFIQFHRW